MNKRLTQFLSAENISQSQLADILGVARASISHIVAGRNKPGFDFIESMMNHFPSLNIEWLILGKGKMYRTSEKSGYGDAGLFDDVDKGNNANEETAPLPITQPTSEIITLENLSKQVENKRNIKKIIVFYSDNTWEEIS